MSTLAVLGMVLGAGTASASLFMPLQSQFTFQLGSLPQVVVQGLYRDGGWASLSAGNTSLAVSSSIWKTTSGGGGTSLFTGVALLSNLKLTGANMAGTFTTGYTATNPLGGLLTSPSSTPSSGTLCPTGCMGGLQHVTGQNVLFVMGVPLPFDNVILGYGGTGTVMVGSAAIVATGAPWISGKARITAITSNVLKMPGRGNVTGIGITLAPTTMEEVQTLTTMGGVVTTNPSGVLKTQATATLQGTNNLTASGAGALTLVSPIRINATVLGVGSFAGRAMERFVFVPEPGTMLLLVSGAAGLIALGRKRMRK